jgi:MraZ protein
MLPPEFRDAVMAESSDGKLVLAKFDDCVIGYPMARWEEIEESFGRIKNPNRRVRDFIRFFFGSAQEVLMDRQGRILVPPSLRAYGRLDKDVILVGVGHKFEVWDKARFEGVESQDFGTIFDDIAATGVEVSI